MSDLKNADLVHKSIQEVKRILLNKKIQELKISDIVLGIKISKSKFFSFFGGINTILELALMEELNSCYQLISSNIKNLKEKKKIITELRQLRTIYIRKNKILFNYFQYAALLPNRYNELKETISLNERDLLLSILKENAVDRRSLRLWRNIFGSKLKNGFLF
ncbi:MAG: hypothetical protein WC623_17260 [Pedobacter sp.]|uniref:hypothetical protein n=1 Tax=Pedobacter sp. TaxID=1411316 RepID=UPI00356880A2